MKERIHILSIPIDPIREDELLPILEGYIKKGGQHFIATINPEFIIEAQKNQPFREILQKTDLNVADGIGIVWAAKYLKLKINEPRIRSRVAKARYRKIWSIVQGFVSLASIVLYPKFLTTEIPTRISGSKLVDSLVQMTSTGDCSIYLLGGVKGVAASARLELERKYPHSVISGSRSGYKTKGNQETNFADAVNKAKPDILIVAMGSPKQEKWIFDNLNTMPSVKIAVGVGGVLDYLAKHKKNPPAMMQRFGLEWMYRLWREPERLPRIRNATYRFISEIIKSKARSW